MARAAKASVSWCRDDDDDDEDDSLPTIPHHWFVEKASFANAADEPQANNNATGILVKDKAKPMSSSPVGCSSDGVFPQKCKGECGRDLSTWHLKQGMLRCKTCHAVHVKAVHKQKLIDSNPTKHTCASRACCVNLTVWEVANKKWYCRACRVANATEIARQATGRD